MYNKISCTKLSYWGRGQTAQGYRPTGGLTAAVDYGNSFTV